MSSCPHFSAPSVRLRHAHQDAQASARIAVSQPDHRILRLEQRQGACEVRLLTQLTVDQHPLNAYSVSHDRTAVVWQAAEDCNPTKWQPCQVMMRLKRAALCVAWAPGKHRKFAVGSASGTVAVCYPDPTQGWFASKPIKRKHNGSVVALAWAPDGTTLATASTDGHCRVLCAGIKGAGMRCCFLASVDTFIVLNGVNRCGWRVPTCCVWQRPVRSGNWCRLGT